MRALAWALGLLLVFHLLAAVAFVGWMGASGRIDRQRLKTVVATFELTIDEQKRQEDQAAELEKQLEQQAKQAARLEAVAAGPRTSEDRLAAATKADEIARLRLERIQRETGDIRRNVAEALVRLADQKADLDAERQAFQKLVAKQSGQLRDEAFEQAVQMVEQLKAKQAKQFFLQLMDQGQTDQVVQYLAAMQLRKAGAVLKQFKEDDEITQATVLLEMLRKRGIDPVGKAVRPAANNT